MSTEKRSGTAASRLTVFGWVALLITLPAILYIAHVVSHLEQIERRSFRVLDNAATRIEKTLNAAYGNVANLSKDVSFAAEFLDRQPYLKVHGKKDELKAWLEQLCASEKWSASESCRPEEEFTASFQREGENLLLVGEPPDTGTGQEDTPAPANGSSRSGDRDDSEGAEPSADGKNGAYFKIRVDFEAILADIPLSEPLDDLEPLAPFGEWFDHMFIADGEGSVIFHPEPTPGTGRRGLRLIDLEQVLSASDAASSGGTGSERSFASSIHSSFARELVLADQEFDLYCQPLKIHNFADATSPTATWAVCGLTASERSVRQALGVVPQLALALFLVLVFVILTWPFIKLFFMDRRERFKLRDMYALLLSSFVCLLLGGILVLGSDSYFRLRGHLRGSLERMAADLEQNLLNELSLLHWQLRSYDDALCGGNLCTSPQPNEEPQTASGSPIEIPPFLGGDTRLLIARDQESEEPDPGSRSAQLCLQRPEHPFLTSVFWMDRSAKQFAKGTIRDHNTPPVSLGKRLYFQEVKNDRLWSLDEASTELANKLEGDQEGQFYFQTYRSVTTGRRSSALSIRSCLSDTGWWITGQAPAPEPSLVVAAITSELVSVWRPVLPPGFSFVIVDASGNAVFHSDPLRALDENLLDEIGNEDRLRSAMRSRTARHFNSQYLTRPHMVYVEPMEVVPWWVVVLYDQELVRTVNLEAVGQAIFLAALYLLLVSVPILFLGFRTRSVRCLWPDAAKRELYRTLSRVYGVAAAIFLVVLFLLRGESLVLATVLIPLLAAAVTGWLLWRWRQTERPGGVGPESRNLKPYLTASILWWTVVALLPGFGFFAATWQDEMETLARYQGLHLVASTAERLMEIDEDYRELAGGDEVSEQRRALTDDLYLPQSPGNDVEERIFQATVSYGVPAGSPDGAEGSPTGGAGAAPSVGAAARSTRGSDRDPADTDLASSIARFKPIYNRSSENLRYLLDTIAADGSVEWKRLGGALQLRAEKASLGESVVVRTQLARPGPWPGGTTVLGGLVLVALLVAWVRFCAYRIFFAGIPRQFDPLDVRMLAALKQNVIAHIASPVDRRKLLASNVLEVVDLRGSDRAATEEALDAMSPTAGPADRPVVCSNFESGLHVRELRDWKLRQLERLVFELQRVVVLPTALNPFEDLLAVVTRGALADQPVADSGGPDTLPGKEPVIQLGADEAQRWVHLLSEFILRPVGLDLKSSMLAEAGDPKGLTGVDRLQDLARNAHRLAHHEIDQEELERGIEEHEGYFWAVWNACSDDERLTLVHLVQEKVVNPEQDRTVRGLLQRGLLKRKPDLQTMTRDFHEFVSTAHEPQKLALWEQPATGLGWGTLKWAFMSLLAVLALFLFATQQALFDATLGLISALALGIPGLLRLMGAVGRGGQGEV